MIDASPWAGHQNAQSVASVLEAGVRYETAMAEWAAWAATQFGGEEAEKR